MAKPTIGITMGDAAGIGPEIIIKACDDESIYQVCKPLVIADAKILEKAKRFLGSQIAICPVDSVVAGRYEPGTLDCLDLDVLTADIPFGQVSASAGHAAYRCVEKAIALANVGEVDAVCTAPLNKESIHKAGYSYPGHTEILAALTNTEDYAMMFTSPNLKVILVTIHVGVLDAVRMITLERVYKTISLADMSLRRMGFASPRIGVCGVNPHAGEGGLFGRGEEEEKIAPAVDLAAKEGIDAVGPLAADTLFYRARRGDFDIVVAMFHDQGLAPIKVLGMEVAVNVTVGLPVIRTSVDHGTAFDIAGKGVADETNMKAAICQAAELVRANTKWVEK